MEEKSDQSQKKPSIFLLQGQGNSFSLPVNREECASLLLKISQGDKEAYQKLYQTFHLPVQKIIFGFVGKMDTAEDLTQDFFTALWKKNFSYEPKEFISGEAFLFRWVRNHCIDYLRKKQIPLASLEAERSYTPTDPLLRNELSQVMHQSLSRLPQNQFLVLTLREMEGLSLGEIAQILDMTERAVEGLLYRAKKKLVEYLKPYMK